MLRLLLTVNLLLICMSLSAQDERKWSVNAAVGILSMSGEYENRADGLVYLGSRTAPAATIDFMAPMNGINASVEVRYAVQDKLTLSAGLVGMDATSRSWTFGRIGSGGFFSQRRVGGSAAFTSLGGRLGLHAPLLRIRRWYEWQIGAQFGLHAFETTYTSSVGITDRQPEGYQIIGTMSRTERDAAFELCPATRMSFFPFPWLDINVAAHAGAMFTVNTDDSLVFGYAGVQVGLGYRF